MCYCVYLSTTSNENFGELKADLFRLVRPDAEEENLVQGQLAHPHLWYLESQYGGCSCHFRHSMGDTLGPPEDWSPEDADHILSTKAVYEVITRIVAEGHETDLIDVWNGDEEDDLNNMEISVSRTPVDSFRFLEGFRFRFVP